MRKLKVKTVKESPEITKFYSNQAITIIRKRIIEQSATTDSKGYVSTICDNLIPTVSLDDFYCDLERGDGNELKSKFRALYSSSALSVNFFSFFKRHRDKFSLAGEDNFSEAEFEKKLPTGLNGTSPNLDFYLENKNSIIGIESKFLELLKPEKPKFSASYSDKFLAELDDGLPTIVNHFRKNAEPTFLDTAQLVKHSIGLLNNKRKRSAKLIYVYWQPLNPDNFPVYKQHKTELDDFLKMIKDISGISFFHFTYLELCNKFKTDIFFKQHLQHFKDKYLLTI